MCYCDDELISTGAVAGLVVGLLFTAHPAWAAGVVGDGTPASCTEAALDSALSAGGSVTFDCGASSVTITITSTKIIGADTTIDGGSADHDQRREQRGRLLRER